MGNRNELNDRNRFAFLIHPLSSEDVSRKFSLARYLPEKWTNRLLAKLPPMKISEITGVESAYGRTSGNFVGVMLTSRQMVELPEAYVLKRIIEAGRKAEKLGAKILGLGAFTSVVGDAGVTVARNLQIAVTTGNSLTAATAIAGTRQAAEAMNLDLKKARVVVVGATGSIGTAVSRILAKEVRQLTLVARNESRLEAAAQTVRRLYGESVSVDYSNNLAGAVRLADVVLATSSSAEALIQPEYLKPGAIVCDIARPRDTSEQVAKERDDVLVFDGGVLEVPGDVDFGLNFGFPPGMTYACMAETMILALERRFENYSLGREYQPEKIVEIYELAMKHGFKLAALRFNERVLNREQYQRIQENARKKMSGKASYRPAANLS
jgi:predicted amino acid dehydrogenase